MWRRARVLSRAGTQVGAEVTPRTAVTPRLPSRRSHHPLPQRERYFEYDSLKTSASAVPQLRDSGQVPTLPEPQLHPEAPTARVGSTLGLQVPSPTRPRPPSLSLERELCGRTPSLPRRRRETQRTIPPPRSSTSGPSLNRPPARVRPPASSYAQRPLAHHGSLLLVCADPDGPPNRRLPAGGTAPPPPRAPLPDRQFRLCPAKARKLHFPQSQTMPSAPEWPELPSLHDWPRASWSRRPEVAFRSCDRDVVPATEIEFAGRQKWRELLRPLEREAKDQEPLRLRAWPLPPSPPREDGREGGRHVVPARPGSCSPKANSAAPGRRKISGVLGPAAPSIWLSDSSLCRSG